MKKEKAKGNIMGDFAKGLAPVSSTYTKADRDADLLAKLKDTAGDSTLKIEDLEKNTAKAAKNNVAALVKAEGTTSTAEIKAAIKAQTGEDVSDEVAKRYRKDAEQSNLFDVMKNAKDAAPGFVAVLRLTGKLWC